MLHTSESASAYYYSQKIIATRYSNITACYFCITAQPVILVTALILPVSAHYCSQKLITTHYSDINACYFVITAPVQTNSFKQIFDEGI